MEACDEKDVTRNKTLFIQIILNHPLDKHVRCFADSHEPKRPVHDQTTIISSTGGFHTRLEIFHLNPSSF